MTALKKRKLKRAVFIVSFLIIPTVHFIVFYLYVNFNSFLMAFQEEVGGETIWTLNTMKNMFSRLFPLDAEMREVFRNTFLTFGIQMVMFFVGMFVSYFLYKKIFLHNAFRVLFFLPSIVSGVVFCNVYIEFLSVQGELAHVIQRMFGMADVPELLGSSRYANAAVLVNMVWMIFPGNLLIWGGTFSRIPDSVTEAARLDGVNAFQEAFRIIIPIVWPTFALLFIMQFAGIFSATGNAFLLTGGQHGTKTLSVWMYLQVYYTAADPRSNLFNMMSALGLVITLISSVLALSLRKITGKMFAGVEY